MQVRANVARLHGTQVLCACILAGVASTGLWAQPSGDLLARYRTLNLPEVDGPALLIYSPEAEARARRYQKTLAGAVAWFNEQLGTDVRIALAVVDRELCATLEPSRPFPHLGVAGAPFKALAVLPYPVEEIPGLELFGEDPDLAVEAMSFHEVGHAFEFTALDLSNARNGFFSEFIANVFMAGFVRERYPQASFITAGPPSAFPKQRYTSLVDLDYLGHPGMADLNYHWFELQVARLAALWIAGRDFPAAIKDLTTAFPKNTPRLSVEQVLARLAERKPGFTESLGDLAGPTTIRRVEMGPCTETVPGDAPSFLVAVNESDEPFGGATFRGAQAAPLPPGEVGRLIGKVGERLEFPGDRCIVMGSEPGVFIWSGR